MCSEGAHMRCVTKGRLCDEISSRHIVTNARAADLAAAITHIFINHLMVETRMARAWLANCDIPGKK